MRADGVGPIAATISSLTWNGHEFLDNVRNDTVWAKLKRAVAEKGGAVSFDVLKALALSYAKAHVFGSSQ